MFSEAISSISSRWRPSSRSMARAISGSASARLAPKKLLDAGRAAAGAVGLIAGLQCGAVGAGDFRQIGMAGGSVQQDSGAGRNIRAIACEKRAVNLPRASQERDQEKGPREAGL